MRRSKQLRGVRSHAPDRNIRADAVRDLGVRPSPKGLSRRNVPAAGQSRGANDPIDAALGYGNNHEGSGGLWTYPISLFPTPEIIAAAWPALNIYDAAHPNRTLSGLLLLIPE